jgi:hypothetical protein
MQEGWSFGPLGLFDHGEALHDVHVLGREAE